MGVDLDDPKLNLCKLTTQKPQEPPTFSPPLCWDPQFFALRTSHTRFLPGGWVPRILEDTPPLVEAPSRLPTDLELITLHAYQLHVRGLVIEDILAQNVDGFPFASEVIRPLQTFLAKYNAQAFLTAIAPMLAWAQQDAAAAVVQQKALINRARPYQVDRGITPAFDPPPGHPSYPSGHSTQAHSVAYLITDVLGRAADPNEKLAGAAVGVLSKAREIAVNREIAGVHYPSDTLAGMQLARRLADEYESQDEFKTRCFLPAIDALNQLVSKM